MSLCALWLGFKTGRYHNRLDFLVGLLMENETMDISKHKALKEIHEAMGMVENLGCNEELTALSVKLGEIAETTEKLVDEFERAKTFIPMCG